MPFCMELFMGVFKDISSKQFGHWYVLNRVFKENGKTHWRCKCKCGKEYDVNASHLLNGASTKCKTCHNKQAVAMRPIIHGNCTNKPSKEYRIWSTMKTRCLNKNHQNYRLYGGRGITISNRWLHFNNFLNEMGKCPSGMTLERKNVNGNYSKRNCVWATTYTQCRNKRTNVYKTAYGKKMIITDWARAYKMPYTSFRRLIDNIGWPLPEAPK